MTDKETDLNEKTGPLYEVINKEKSGSASKGSDSDYSVLAVSTLNRESVYATVASGKPTTSKAGKKSINYKIVVCCIAVSASVVVLLALFAALFAEIASLKSQFKNAPLAQLHSEVLLQQEQLNRSLSGIRDVNNSFLQLDTRLNSSLAGMRQLDTRLNNSLSSIEDVNNSILQLDTLLNISVDEIFQQLHIISTQFREDIDSIEKQLLQTSCAALSPSSPSGYYWVRASNGSAVRVYCDMTRVCGGVTGGWMRVAKLDMTDSSEVCPQGFERRMTIFCRRSSSSSGCSMIGYPTVTVYSKICGMIIGKQERLSDAFTGQNDISRTYVDGVSLTYDEPKKHIWTFAGGFTKSSCPCSTNTRGRSPPAFVRNDYFCDAGTGTLWDGENCPTSDSCCSYNNPPWFYKQLQKTTTDDIEMRVCRDQERDNEDVLIKIIEIYIQ